MTVLLKDALTRYREEVSCLKKGHAQEAYRIEQIRRSFLGTLLIEDVSSVHIATYRDQRLKCISPRTGRLVSTATVRLELALLGNFFDIARTEWGLVRENPTRNVRKPKPAPGRDRRVTAREERRIIRHCLAHPNQDLYSIVVVALETAMRQSEILGLRWEHLNLKSR